MYRGHLTTYLKWLVKGRTLIHLLPIVNAIIVVMKEKKEEAEDVTIDRVPASSSKKQKSVDDGVYNKPEEKQEAI